MNIRLKELLLTRFCENFAAQMAAVVVDEELVGDLLPVVTGVQDLHLSHTDRKKVRFRAAYILETVYFNYPRSFAPYKNRLIDDFMVITSESAKRHYGKIVYHILNCGEIPGADKCSDIARTCVLWATEPKVRVAVVIWAMEILLLLCPRVDWVQEVVDELLDTLSRNPTPAMTVSLRRWRAKQKRKF